MESVFPSISAWFSCLLAGALWLCASCVIVIVPYHLVFHPLAKYPGPFWARVSHLYHLFHESCGDTHLNIRECHSRYGHVLRYSPNQLTFNTSSAFRDIYGNGKSCHGSKSCPSHPSFSGGVPTPGFLDQDDQGQRRRLIGQAFTASALTFYEQVIIKHTQISMKTLMQISETDWFFPRSNGWSVPYDIGQWSTFLALDIISDLTYGKTFNHVDKLKLLQLAIAARKSESQRHLRNALSWLHNNRSSGLRRVASWVFGTLEDEPKRISELLARNSKEREASPESLADRTDVVSILLAAHDQKTGYRLSASEVWDAVDSMIRAADATSTVLSSALIHLSHDKLAYDKLTTEIRTTFPTLESIHQGPLLSSCHYLRACIDETLRLTPSTNSPTWRAVTSNGATIDNHLIPPGCEVSVSLHALHHNPTYFPDPDTFNPNRFLPTSNPANQEPTLKKPKFDFFPSSRANTKFPVSPSTLSPDSFQGMYFPSSFSATGGAKENPAFAPFGVGAGRCLGKGFVYLQLSLALARVLWCLDLRAAEEVGKGWRLEVRKREGVVV